MTLPDPETCRALGVALRDSGKLRRYVGMLWINEHGGRWRSTTEHEPEPGHPAIPDLRDPLTAAGMLLVARAAWADPDIYCCNLDGYDGCGWTCIIDRPDHPNARHGVLWISAPTELEALVAAILAAPEK